VRWDALTVLPHFEQQPRLLEQSERRLLGRWTSQLFSGSRLATNDASATRLATNARGAVVIARHDPPRHGTRHRDRGWRRLPGFRFPSAAGMRPPRHAAAGDSHINAALSMLAHAAVRRRLVANHSRPRALKAQEA